jgi:uncharacterized membrane protein
MNMRAGASAVFGAALVMRLPALFTLALIAWKLSIQTRCREALGTVRDAVLRTPLGLALLRLYDANTGCLLTTRVTSERGQYLLPTTLGVYTLSVARDGYAPFREPHIVVRADDRETLARAVALTPLLPRPMAVG